MALTDDDARAIADDLLDAAKDIDKYLDDNWGSMSRVEYETLSESASTLLRISSKMTTLAVGLSIEDMADDSAELKATIAQARKSLAKLKAVGKAIRVVAGLVDLATAIVSRDPKAIFNAARGLHATATAAEAEA